MFILFFCNTLLPDINCCYRYKKKKEIKHPDLYFLPTTFRSDEGSTGGICETAADSAHFTSEGEKRPDHSPADGGAGC